MSDPQLPGNDGRDGRPRITATRLVLWIVGAVIAIYLITSGIIGIITKGQ